MRIRDVIATFASNIVRYTDAFSDLLSGTATVAGQTVTVTTPTAHGLQTGYYVSLPDRRLSNPITAVEAVAGGYQFTTAVSHDLTLGYHTTAFMSGFADGAWNGDHELISVPNRTSFVVKGPNLPVLTGAERLYETIEVGGLSGPVPVTVVSATSFSFPLGLDPGGRGVVTDRIVANVRVTGGPDWERLRESYTRQKKDELWAFITPSPVSLSKDRRASTDAIAEVSRRGSMRQTVLDGFSLYIAVPTSEAIAGLQALDLCRHDLQLPIWQSLRGVAFDTGATNSTPFAAEMLEHDIESYEGSHLFYRYVFQCPYQITSDDASQEFQSVAYRNIVLETDLETGTRFSTNTINLDEAP